MPSSASFKPQRPVELHLVDLIKIREILCRLDAQRFCRRIRRRPRPGEQLGEFEARHRNAGQRGQLTAVIGTGIKSVRVQPRCGRWTFRAGPQAGPCPVPDRHRSFQPKRGQSSAYHRKAFPAPARLARRSARKNSRLRNPSACEARFSPAKGVEPQTAAQPRFRNRPERQRLIEGLGDLAGHRRIGEG